MTARSLLGDICQHHDPRTAPVAYPHSVTAEGSSLHALYRCECGAEWPCWWDMHYAGWTPEDAASFVPASSRSELKVLQGGSNGCR